MWKKYNSNPCGRNVSDCAVRAVSKALNIDWETTYMMLADMGMNMCDLPNSDAVWGAVLRQNGFKRKSIPDECPECFTVRDFCYEFPYGTYVLGTGNHAVTIVNGDYYDAWDSGSEIPLYYWHT